MKDQPSYRVLTRNEFSGNVMRLGGTILGTTNKGNPFAFPMADGSTKDMSEKIIDGFRKLGLDAVIGIGGDGSFAILKRLTELGGINLVGVPKTIDNDVKYCDRTFGYFTAVAEADTLLLTVPNQLGVDYNAHVIESILKHVAPALGWR